MHWTTKQKQIAGALIALAVVAIVVSVVLYKHHKKNKFAAGACGDAPPRAARHRQGVPIRRGAVGAPSAALLYGTFSDGRPRPGATDPDGWSAPAIAEAEALAVVGALSPEPAFGESRLSNVLEA